MNEYIKIVEDYIKEYEELAIATEYTLGYGLERKSAIVWDTLEDNLKGYIDEELYNDLYSRWNKIVKKVYDNKNLCIC